MATIEDVAREAGVSVATVSRVINQKGPVSPKSVEKVHVAIAKLNYQPNVWGRRLRRQESRMILIFVPNISNPFYASIVSGIEDTMKKDGYGTMLCITNGDKSREEDFIKLLYDGQADGAVILCIDKNDRNIGKLAKEFPIVQCCEYCVGEDISHVSVDNFAAARQVVQYLTSLGHERIGFVGSVNQFISSEDRQKGFEAGGETHGYLLYLRRAGPGRDPGGPQSGPGGHQGPVRRWIRRCRIRHHAQPHADHHFTAQIFPGQNQRPDADPPDRERGTGRGSLPGAQAHFKRIYG